MPPHCDSLDGPVVRAARVALETGDLDEALAYVPPEGEQELAEAFELACIVRALGPEARTLADRSFYETVVRVHRAGEGAPYTGLKPAGLDVGPVIPVAERAIAAGSPDELVELLCAVVRHEVRRRFDRMLELRPVNGDVEAHREHVEAVLGLQVWAHSLHEAAEAQPHEHGHARSESAV